MSYTCKKDDEASAFIYKLGDINQIIIYSLERHNIMDDVVSSDIFLPVNIYHPKNQKSLRQATIIQHFRLSRLADSLTPTIGSDSTQIL